MNYLEIFNKVMLELNLRPIEQFENIYKNEHLRILENIRRVNSEICTSHNWDFLLREDEIELEAGETDSGYDVSGRITAVYEAAQAGAPGTTAANRLRFGTDYTTVAQRIHTPVAQKPRTLRVFYTTKNTALNARGEETENFSAPTDVSLIPEPFASDVLVYGSCIKTKANPAFVKFGFWNANYIRALARLRAESPASKDDVPTIRIMRRI